MLLACPAAARAAAHDTLTIGMVQFPPDMHPDITNTSIKTYISAAAARDMTGFDRDGTVICILCTEVPTLANGRAKIVKRADGSNGMVVTYTIKPGLFWADGVPVTAKDFVFSYEVAKAFSPPVTVENVEAPDASTVRVTLNRVRYDFDRSGPSPMSEHVEGPIFRAAKNPIDYGEHSDYDRHPENPGLWMGPYKITSFKPGQSVTLEPNPYWTGQKPYFHQVTMRLIENTAALQANLLAGDVDMVAPGNLGLTLDQVNALAKSDAARFDFSFQPAVTSYEHLTVRLDNPLLADKRARQAMAMAIDRKTIVARLFDNRVDPAYSFKHPSQFGWDKSVKEFHYDPTAARALLAQAGFKPGPDGILLSPTGKRFSVDIVTTSGNRIRDLMEQVLQTEMKAIGIELVVHNQPARVMFGQTLRMRDFTGLVEFQSDQPLDYVPYYTLDSDWIPSAGNNWSGTNYMGLRDKAMDAALNEAWAALDPVARKAAWKRILDIYADEVPEIDLYFAASATITPKWLTGVVSTVRWGNPTNWIEDWKLR